MEIRRDFNAAQVVILPLLVQEDDANNTHVTESHGKSLSPEKQQTRDGKLQEANVVPALPGEFTRGYFACLVRPEASDEKSIG